MNLTSTTIQDICNELKQVAFPGFCSLPYNRHDVARSQHYWLSPTANKVAHPYAKIMATIRDNWVPDGEVFVGFNVEKGQQMGKLNPDPQCEMDVDWWWHKFVKRANIPLARMIDEAADNIGQTLQIFVGIEIQGGKGAHVRFNVKGTSLSVVDFRVNDPELNQLALSKNLEQFQLQLNELNKLHWHWVDVIVGQLFTKDPSRTNDIEICAAMLEPFREWMLDVDDYD
jgi:hypothetical protein